VRRPSRDGGPLSRASPIATSAQISSIAEFGLRPRLVDLFFPRQDGAALADVRSGGCRSVSACAVLLVIARRSLSPPP